MTDLASHSAPAEILESHKAPIHVESVALTVRDLGRVATFYSDVIGLQQISSSGNVVELGNDGVVLVRLTENRHAEPAAPGAPGLFHTAFLMPSRRDLGIWMRTAAQNHWGLEGKADHLVSEAVYLSDPEGNGIEIYSDRPRSQWTFDGKRVRMANVRLDVEGLLGLADGLVTPGKRYSLPHGARIGHVHLCVTDLEDAARAIDAQWGIDEMCRFPGALFFGSGGYHHHFGANIWNARGKDVRVPGQLGLAGVTLAGRDAQSREVLAKRWLATGGSMDGDSVAISALSGLHFWLAPQA